MCLSTVRLTMHIYLSSMPLFSRYRYHSFISDIAGQDIQSHNNNDSEAIKLVRNWLRSTSGRVTIPGGKEILRRYRLFISELPALCKEIKITIDEMIFNDYTNIVSLWLNENPSSSISPGPPGDRLEK